MKNFFRISFFLFLELFSVKGYSQLLPFIQRFQEIQEFESTNDPIVKSIIQSEDGTMYFGKRTGLYSFNGTQWEKIYSSSKEELSDVQVLEKDSLGFIWVVSKNGLGFIKKSGNGVDSVHFFQIKNDSLFKDSDPKKIFFIDNKAYIHTTNNEVIVIPYQYVNQIIKVSEPYYLKDNKYTHLFKLGKRLFFYHSEKGLLELVKGKFIEVSAFASINSAKNNELRAFIPFSLYKGLLCFDKNYYWYDGKDYKIINLENSRLLSSGIFSGVRYDPNSILIATFYEGCLIYDIHTGNLKKQVNPKNGYNEGEIFSVYVDRERGIWIGGKKGLVRVMFSDYLQDYQNLNDIRENVNDVYAFEPNVLFATNNGLYLVQNKNGVITSIEQFAILKDVVCHQIYAFDFDENDADQEHSLLIATNRGLYEYEIHSKKIIPVLSEPVQKILPISVDYALIISSFEIKLIEKDNGKWKKSKPFFETNGIINSIISDQDDSIIWIGTDKGVILLEIDDELNKIKILGSSLAKYSKNEVKKIFNKPYAINKNGVFYYNPVNNKFEKEKELSKFINDRTRFTQWMDKIILYHKNEYLILEKKQNELKIDTIYPLANIAPNPFQIIADNDRQIFIFTKDNIIRFNINVYKQYQKFYAKTDSSHQTQIYKLLINDIPMPLNGSKPVFDVIHHLELYFGGADYQNYGTFLYQYYVEGHNENWSDWKRDKKLVLNGLSYGSYTIHIRIKDHLGRIWKEATISFEINPPFYATTWAIILYIIIGALIVYLIVKLYSANLEKIIKERTLDLENQKKIAEEKNRLLLEANSALEQANEELKISMETIQNQQEQLIKQEKMATLGQLVANTAHELNTPIGAIQNSIRNIENSLPGTFQQLPYLLQKLNKQEQELFFDYAIQAILNKKNLSTQEERQLRMKLENELYQNQIPFADEIAEKLVSIGLIENLNSLLNLLKSRPDITQEIMEMLYLLGKIGTNLNVIHIAADKTKKKVHGLKVYTHSQNDEVLTDINLIESIETVITVYNHYFKHDIELIRNYIHQPQIKGYPDNLMQVWTNLIFNAIQAIGGKGRIVITTEQEGNYALVKIEDNGPGIPDEIKDKIFQPLFTTKPKGEGSGLGLSIVQKIVERHHGEITFESQPGKTVFIVKLPIQWI